MMLDCDIMFQIKFEYEKFNMKWIWIIIAILVVLTSVSLHKFIFSTSENGQTENDSPIQGGIQVDSGNNETISIRPMIATGRDEDIYVVWEDSRFPDKTPRLPQLNGRPLYHIFFSRSLDGGMTFSEDVCLNQYIDNITHVQPNIAIDNSGMIFIIWIEYDISKDVFDSNLILITSTNGGLTFSDPIQLNDDNISININLKEPIIIVDENYIHVSFSGALQVSNDTSELNGDSDIFYYRFQKTTTRKLRLLRVNDDIDHDNRQICPTMVLGDNNSILFAWIDNRDNGSDAIYFSSVTEDYSQKSNVKVGGLIRKASSGPSIAIWKSSIYLIWRDDIDDYPVVLSISEDGGNSFSFPVQINSNETNNYCTNPRILVTNNGTVIVSWNAFSKPLDNYYPIGIFYSISVDGGRTFSNNIELGNYRTISGWGTDQSFSDQDDQSMDFSNNKLHFSYVEGRNDGYYCHMEEFNWGNPTKFSLPSVSYQSVSIQ